MKSVGQARKDRQRWSIARQTSWRPECKPPEAIWLDLGASAARLADVAARQAALVDPAPPSLALLHAVGSVDRALGEAA